MKYIIVFIIMLIYAVNINAKIIILDDQEEIPSKSESSNIDQTNGKNKIESMVYGKPYTVFGVTYYPLDYIHKYEEEGIASWYGADFHGKLTSSKEIYNMHDMTAAHKLLPLGSTVLVKSLENGKEIVVRINDRGPFVKDRIIDLSYKAAKEIGIADKGTGKVKITLLSESPKEFVMNGKPIDINRGNFYIQIGAFVEKNNAEILAAKFLNSNIVEANIKGQKFYRVRLVGFESRQSAEVKLITIEKSFPGAFVVAE